MIEQNQFKMQGLAFGRSLQRAFKIALLYSVDHSAAEPPMRQAYASLNPLLQQTTQFTFGFLSQRVLLNNILTPDKSLVSLEVEFSKRGVGAVCFAIGISFREFKRGLALLSTKPDVIEQNGGIQLFLERNPIEGMRLLPGKKRGSQKEDTVLEMDPQSYLMAQAILQPQPGAGGPGLPGLEALLQSAGMEKPPGFAGNTGEILDLAGKAAQAAWADPQRHPGETVQALAHLLEQITPDSLLSALPPSKQTELRGRSPQEVVADLAEDTAAQWAAQRLSASPAGPAVEEVGRVLEQVVKTTQVAERLLQKLARFVQEANLPAEVTDRIREELRWFALSQEEKHAQLLRLQGFSTQEFRHLVNYVEEMKNRGNIAEATEVAGHYFALLDSAPLDVWSEELPRAPELLRAVACLQTLEFLRAVAARLGKELLDEKRLDWQCHQQVSNCLSGAAQAAALYENFEAVHKIGLDLERSFTRDHTQHSECCGKALRSLLPSASVERLIELYLQKRDDRGWPRIVVSLLKWTGAQGAEVAFQRLEEEPAAANRMRLLRLTGQLGPHCIEPTRNRLCDERWYVVRNACYVLGELSDPELSRRLGQALRHPDVRVQQAAVTSLIKSHAADVGEALAEALPFLQAHLQEVALDELTFRKDPTTLSHLEQFISRRSSRKTGVFDKAIQALAAIPAESAVTALGRILSDTTQIHPVRKAALLALSRSPLSLAQQLLSEFGRSLAPNDRLAAECQSELQAATGATK